MVSLSQPGRPGDPLRRRPRHILFKHNHRLAFRASFHVHFPPEIRHQTDLIDVYFSSTVSQFEKKKSCRSGPWDWEFVYRAGQIIVSPLLLKLIQNPVDLTQRKNLFHLWSPEVAPETPSYCSHDCPPPTRPDPTRPDPWRPDMVFQTPECFVLQCFIYTVCCA